MLTRLLRRRRAAVKGDGGFSLAELLVAMVLMSIFGAVTARLFIAVDTSSSTSTDRSINSASAGTAMEAWTEYLRAADGTTPGSSSNRFEWVTANDMLFYSDLFNRGTTGVGITTTSAATMIWLRLDAKNVLIEEQFPANAAKGANPTACRRLLGNVSATRLFTAYDGLGNQLNAQNLGTAPTASAGCQTLPVTVPSQTNKPDPVAAANLPNVARIAIDFSVPDSTKKHAIEFNSVVTLPVLGGAI